MRRRQYDGSSNGDDVVYTHRTGLGGTVTAGSTVTVVPAPTIATFTQDAWFGGGERRGDAGLDRHHQRRDLQHRSGRGRCLMRRCEHDRESRGDHDVYADSHWRRRDSHGHGDGDRGPGADDCDVHRDAWFGGGRRRGDVGLDRHHQRDDLLHRPQRGYRSCADANTTVNPTATTTYTLTATGIGGTATATVTVTVVPAPTIATFTRTPDSVAVSGAVTLAWTGITNGATCSIDHSVGTVACADGSTTVHPTATTTYTLTVTGIGGTATKTATVTVVPAPTIATFTRSPASVAVSGAVTLAWTGITNGATCSIDHSVGAVVCADGNTTVHPTATTTYTLTVTGIGGTATKTATATVIPAPTIGTFTASYASIVTGTSTTLSWSGITDATSCSIDNSLGAVTCSGGSLILSPTATTTYTFTATGTGGTTTATVTVTVVAAHGSVTFNYTGALQHYDVPNGVSALTITAVGAGGGGANYDLDALADGGVGGSGISVSAAYAGVTAGAKLSVVVGQGGRTYTPGVLAPAGGGGGGGGSFVFLPAGGVMIAAGGGGGGGTTAYPTPGPIAAGQACPPRPGGLATPPEYL